ncbi:MAG: response regulator [Bdellovibrionaceae bacterium]|nr:response regulator [Bdellovibrio sp.]
MENDPAYAPFLSTLVANAPDYICHVDRNGKMRYVNRLPEGLKSEDVIGTDWIDFVATESQVKVKELFRLVIEKGQLVDYETLGTGHNNAPAWYAVRLAPIHVENKIVGAVLIARDITEKKQTEMQLITADRMASTGLLVASVAHEINNPLAAVLLNLEMILGNQSEITKEPSLQARAQEKIKAAYRSAETIAQIVKDLQVFSYEEKDRIAAVDIEHVIDSALRIAGNQLQQRARLTKNFSGLPAVLGNEARLGQVFLNLILNAVHAINEGQVDQNEIVISTQRNENNQAIVSVRDTGEGVPESCYDKVFNPFFTTKPKGLGTGLGLSICKRIITNFGGSIEFKSQLGRGTEFFVTLPLAALVDKAPLNGSEETEVNDNDRSTVLIVDDEVTFRNVLEGVLTDDHDISTAENGNEALELLKQGLRYDVIICDIMMPQMSGVELYDKVKELDSQQADKMVFITGAAFNPSMRSFLESIKNKKLEKPFRLKDLRKLINSISK